MRVTVRVTCVLSRCLTLQSYQMAGRCRDRRFSCVSFAGGVRWEARDWHWLRSRWWSSGLIRRDHASALGELPPRCQAYAGVVNRAKRGGRFSANGLPPLPSLTMSRDLPL